VNPKLPATKIEVLGPPPTSGTRDSFVELYLEAGCRTYAWLDALRTQDEPRFKRACDTVREDGAYVEAGENDNLIVQKLTANKDAIGIFGYSFLEENLDKLKGAVVDGVSPTYDTVASGKYPASRPLFIYVKKAHGYSRHHRVHAEHTSEKRWEKKATCLFTGSDPAQERDRQIRMTPGAEAAAQIHTIS
jgi:phosphate transport system substrate-binding protein